MDILLTSPTHDGRIDYRTAERMYNSASKKYKVGVVIRMSSALVWNMNELYVMALNYRQQYPTLKWFAMCHSDIVPEKFWLDKLIAEAEKHNADMVSAISPLKDASGVVSTAIEAPESGRYPFMRLTLRQCMHADFPDTFDTAAAIDALLHRLPPHLRVPQLAPFKNRANLLINTGAMVLRLDKPWNDELFFYNVDRIFTNPAGQLQAMFEPEDWNFSRSVSQVGKVMATRNVSLQHIGNFQFDNQTLRGHNVDEFVKPVTIWSLEDAKRLHMHSEKLAQWLAEHLPVGEVYDFGCGLGYYVNFLNYYKPEENPFTAQGFEGTPGIKSIALTPAIIEMDITKRLELASEKGSVISLEVMEHLMPGEQEEAALQNINEFCDQWLVLSWAVVGQGGHGHNNCRNADYVVPRIEAFGFKLEEELTASARAAGGQDLPYFNETIYVFKRV